MNAIEALNAKLRRAVRAGGHLPNDDAAMKLLYLVLNNAAEEWKRPPREWLEAKPNLPSSSAKGSSANDENGLAHRIPDSPVGGAEEPHRGEFLLLRRIKP
jgi:hypothetical protein